MRFPRVQLLFLALLGTAKSLPFEADALETRGDPSEVKLCSGAGGSGNCILWTMQTGHWWDFDDEQLAPVRGGLSSIYPQDSNHKWTICNESQGGGVCVGGIVAPGIDNLEDFNFNDQAYSITPEVL